MNTVYIAFAALCLGALGLAFVGQRKFNRRNILGIEQFPSFLSLLCNRLFEGGLRVVAIAAIGFGVIGLATSWPVMRHQLHSNQSASARDSEPTVKHLKAHAGE